MNPNTQFKITDQIYKIQTNKKLIAIYDRLRYAALSNFTQIHAKGEFTENSRKVNSLICLTIQDYSSGTGDKNIIVQFNLSPEQIQFFLTRISSGFQEYQWNQTKIFGIPDKDGYSIAQQFSIYRRITDQSGKLLNNPWTIQISNGKGIKLINKNGGSYMQSNSYKAEKNAFIQLTDLDLYTLLKRTDSYINQWEAYVSSSLITNGKHALLEQHQAQAINQNQMETPAIPFAG